MLTGSSPILATSDVPATVQFYKEVLGFPSSWMWGDPPVVGGVSWGKVHMMFSQNPDLASRIEGQEQWIDVEDVDALYAQHLKQSAQIISEIENKPWDRREYTVRDPNGYHLRFAGDPSHISKGSGQFPAGVEILRRKPALEEYIKVSDGAPYKTNAGDIFERTWAGVVAMGLDGEVIGTARIMRDAPGWFSIWDVAVLPAWQGQRIGTAMIKEALDIVREDSPGAFVYLFTFNPKFYERVGFTEQTVTMRKV